MRAGVNYVGVKLFPPNDKVRLSSGLELYIDTNFEPEKHVQLMGEVVALPIFLRKGNGMEWNTDCELRIGDTVVMYYLAVMNCLSKEQKRYIKEGNEYIIFIRYNNIYARIRDGETTPLNGYILSEPVEDPERERLRKEMEDAGLVMVNTFQRPTQREVTYSRIKYIGKPVRDFDEPDIALKEGDIVMMSKVRDIPVEYEYHTKMDGGKKYYRIRRKDIIAKL